MNMTRLYVGLTSKQWVHISLIVLSALIFTRASSNGKLLNYDDERYIQGNELIEQLDGEHINRIFTEYFDGHYHPLSLLSLSLDRHFSENHVKAHHTTNWLFHVLNACLVYLLLIRLFPNRQDWALGAALLFQLHPMNVESYAWMTERKNVQYAFFFLLSCLNYEAFHRKENSRKYLLLTYLFLIASLLSKAQAVTLFPVFILMDLVQGRKLQMKSAWLNKIPVLVIFIAFLFFTQEAQQASWGDLHSEVYGRFQKLFLASYALGAYFFYGIFPFDLSAYYPYPHSIGRSLDIVHYVSIIWPLGMLGILLWLMKKNLWEAVWGLGFFLLNIVLMLKFLDIPFGDYLMADRYNYLPSVGLMWIAMLLLSKLASRIKLGSQSFLAAIGGIALVFGFLSQKRLAVWNNSVSLWENVIEQYPEYAHAQNMLAISYLQEGKSRQAKLEFEKLVKLDPGFEGGYENLATLELASGQKTQALSAIEKAMEFRPSEPKTLMTAYSLYMDNKKYQKALVVAESLKDLESQDENHSLRISKALIGLGELEKAEKLLATLNSSEAQKLQLQLTEKDALQDPVRKEARKLLNQATELGKRGDLLAADQLFTKSLEMDSLQFNAYLNRGSNYAMMKNYDKALKDYLKARSLAPNSELIHLMLAAVYKDLNQREKSCESYERSQELGARPTEELANYCK
jgi:tetratricopeptide (TPR) repeat protein